MPHQSHLLIERAVQISVLGRFCFALPIPQLPKRPLQRTLRLIDRTLIRLIDGGSLITDRDRIEAARSGFQLTANIVALALLIAIFVGDMNLDARELGREALHRIRDGFLDLADEAFAAFDMTARVDLNLHV